jgi:hypothetical protein
MCFQWAMLPAIHPSGKYVIWAIEPGSYEIKAGFWWKYI